MQKIGLILLTSLLLASCGASYYTTNGEKHYLQSRNGPNLVVPPPLTKTNMSEFYNLPPQDNDPRVSIEPPVVSQ